MTREFNQISVMFGLDQTPSKALDLESYARFRTSGIINKRPIADSPGSSMIFGV